MGNNSQRAKLSLKAIPYPVSERKDDYYLNVKQQNKLTIDDLAAEVASTHGHHRAAEVAMLAREVLELANWYLSNGYTVVTPQGNFRVTVQGTLLDSELASAPNREKLRLNVAYTMGEEMRQMLTDAELDVEITKAATGPQIYSVVDARQADMPDVSTKVPIPIEPGQTVIIRGRSIKIGGEGEDIGVTLTRTDDSSGTKLFFPVSRLYPNTPTKVGFVLPSDVEEGSTWEVTLCTQVGSNGTLLLKTPRSVTMPDTFTVGEASSPGTGGGTEPGGGSGSGTGEDDGDHQLG